MASVEIKVPALGESITEAVVGKLNKKVGDTVAADEAIAVLETDKVTIDVQAASAGVISALSATEGAKVKIGDVIGTIDSSQAGAPAGRPSAAAPAPVVAAAAPAATNGTLVTPVARAVAADKGIDPSTIAGSGAQGRVMKDDVLRAAEGGSSAKGPASTPLNAPTGPRGEERVKMTPLRKRVAERLLQAQSTAAILTTFRAKRVVDLVHAASHPCADHHPTATGISGCRQDRRAPRIPRCPRRLFQFPPDDRPHPLQISALPRWIHATILRESQPAPQPAGSFKLEADRS